MNLVQRLRSHVISWWKDTPVPSDASIPDPNFQAWHEFDDALDRWTPIDNKRRTTPSLNDQDRAKQASQPFVLATWNVNYSSTLLESRIGAIISHINPENAPGVDIIFLQEVSTGALLFLLNNTQIRRHWFLSESWDEFPQKQPFATMTLLSRMRFGYPNESSREVKLGAVWRVNYPSRFGRDALCCDILIPSSRRTANRIRLINVHLDSLPFQPSQRPKQIAIAASFLRRSDGGVVAGDFNPVLPEDETLIQDNGLLDAWPALHPEEPGFTWGVDGKQLFPPNRMDRVALLGLDVLDIKVLRPGLVGKATAIEAPTTTKSPLNAGTTPALDEPMPWSDHSGLRCSFKLAEP